MIKTASVYDLKRDGGKNVLVTRLWPRGIRKRVISAWFKELGPRYELLRNFKDGKIGWSGFRKAYLAGLKSPESRRAMDALKVLAARKSITLLCVCRDDKRCHRSLLRARIKLATR